MSSFRSMKYQILAAAALLLGGPYITAAADPADQAQWSESVPLGDSPWAGGPGQRIEAYIVDGLLHVRRLDQNDSPRWHLILAEADPNQPPTLEHSAVAPPSKCATPTACTSSATPFRFPLALAAHRQQLAPKAFASLDTTVRQNGIDPTRNSLHVTPISSKKYHRRRSPALTPLLWRVWSNNWGRRRWPALTPPLWLCSKNECQRRSPASTAALAKVRPLGFCNAASSNGRKMGNSG